ncbi:MAG: ROK family protein [Bacteroidetes bacterium]|nr:ROK family protein [Bacteroidota bacterium]
MSNNIVIGVDIGGSHITAAQIDLKSHSIIRESLVRYPVNSKGTADEVIREWTDALLVCKTYGSQMPRKIGIAIPGPFDYDKGISLIKDLDKYESLYLLNVKELIASRLDINHEDIFMMNDASSFLKGEIFCADEIENCTHLAGLTLGTGLGSATWTNGVISEGDLYCTAFKNGTAEDYLSTRWFISRYKELTGISAKNVKEIRDMATSDSNAASIFTGFGQNLGEVLSSFCKKHQTEKVIIGGNIIKAWDLFINDTQLFLKNNSINVQLLQARLGEEAALIGAASLCSQS